MPRRKIRAHYEHMSEFERGRAIELNEAGLQRLTEGTQQKGRTEGFSERLSKHRIRLYLPFNVCPAHKCPKYHQQATEKAESKSSQAVTMTTPHTCTPTIFSDESRFLLCPDDRRKHFWRWPGQSVDPGLTFEHQTGPQQDVMAWLALLKNKEGNYESKPGPAALPYPPFRQLLSFSLNLEGVTTPLIFTNGSKSDSGVGAEIIFLSQEHQPVLLWLHPDCTAFQAELLAILWTAQIAETSPAKTAVTIARTVPTTILTGHGHVLADITRMNPGTNPTCIHSLFRRATASRSSSLQLSSIPKT
ncbi:hypothetical protein LAZ67_3002484 [Cordylochernes scorpioides]|uniref:Uncharacterized protein n=1 Tax=Cordylochernes scorpioides TaxID=51811 RepID=A0ABY6K7X4_9ARAC|nr:hypothetical protein LAZ67_3002484 [Cordylochernes scorpioides]